MSLVTGDADANAAWAWLLPVVGGATVTTGSLLLIDSPIVPWSESLDKALELDKYTYVTLLASLSSTVLGVLVLTSVD